MGTLSGRNCSLTAVKVQYITPIAPCIFRVKELGPGGPVEGKPAEIGMPENYHMGTMSPQNSALALLKYRLFILNSTEHEIYLAHKC